MSVTTIGPKTPDDAKSAVILVNVTVDSRKQTVNNKNREN